MKRYRASPTRFPVWTGVFVIAGTAWAQSQLALEAGSELDTNLLRVEEEAKGSRETPPIAPVARLGLRWGTTWKSMGNKQLFLQAALSGKKKIDARDITPGDAATLNVEARAIMRHPNEPLILTAGVIYRDVFEPTPSSSYQPLDYRTADVFSRLTLWDTGKQSASATFGYRLFHFKPDASFQYQGEYGGVAYLRTYSKETEEPAPTYDLIIEYGVQRRSYSGHSFAYVCVEPNNSDPFCRQLTSLHRKDLLHTAAVEVRRLFGWFGGARYELQLNQSSSSGESFIRHRFEWTSTVPLWPKWFATGKMQLQRYKFEVPVVLNSLLTIEEEHRNALFFHLLRRVGKQWSAEARYAFHFDQLTPEDIRYRRHIFYLGLLYQRE